MIDAPPFTGPSGAIFSPNRFYRYVLWRCWARSLPAVAFVGLNPSKADEHNPDPTVTRCVNFAKSWGYGRMFMLNLFAWRDTDPDTMLLVGEPVGDENDYWLNRVQTMSAATVACWTNHGLHRGRAGHVIEHVLTPPLYCFRLNKGTKKRPGQPMHPLYVKGDRVPVLWLPPGGNGPAFPLIEAPAGQARLW